jgi:hypothetical protein
VPETDNDIRLFAIYSYRFKPPEKMYERFKSIEAISALRGDVRGECDGAADVNRDGRDTSLDALMILQTGGG